MLAKNLFDLEKEVREAREVKEVKEVVKKVDDKKVVKKDTQKAVKRKAKKVDIEKIENLPSFINLKDCTVVDLKAVVYNYKGYKGKARVYSNKEVVFLRSYNTCVGYVNLKDKTLTITGAWGQTTTTHLRDFIYQYFNRLDLNHKQIKALGTLCTNKALKLKDIKDFFKSEDKDDTKKELKEK